MQDMLLQRTTYMKHLPLGITPLYMNLVEVSNKIVLYMCCCQFYIQKYIKKHMGYEYT